ncbi:hypothetical protein MASR2M66_28930 [Chloroflexota bacterium]
MIENLFVKSSIWAQKAMRSYLEEEYEHFCVQAGVAFELLGKSLLANIHPSLIVDGDFDSLLQVCGAGSYSKRAPGNIRTIGAKDVLVRIIQIVPQIKSYEQQLVFLSNMRNGVVHIGSIETTNLSDVINSFLRASQIIVKQYNAANDDFFGEYLSTVNKFLDESSKEIERIVAIKLDHAKRVFTEKYGEFDKKTVEELAEAIRQLYALEEYYDEYEQCPVCPALGIASGNYEVDWEFDDPDDTTPSPKVTLFVHKFECRMCGLILKNLDEIKAAHMKESLELDADKEFLLDLGYESP